MNEEHRGILRNAQTHDYTGSGNEKYDRRLVLENTKKNAELFAAGSTEGDKIREAINRKKKLEQEERDNVHFNKENLDENDKIKASMTFTKIDEPKTPYQGPVNETNDYYREDNEDEPEVNGFSLGEGQDENNDEDNEQDEIDKELESLHGSKIIPDDEVAKELKHKKFEEMRKMHYHNEVIHPLRKTEKDYEDDEMGNEEDA